MKKFFCILAILSCLFALVAQESTTVEQQYLSAPEDIVITELAASPDRDNKLVALQYIERSIESNRKTPEMTMALSELAGEGTYNATRLEGRVVNNYSDVRIRASELLGQMGTPEAQDVLQQIIHVDNEPSVVAAAIRSAGENGIVEDNNIVDVIEMAHRKFSILNPTSSLALEVLNAIEMLAPKVDDKSAMVRTAAEIATNYRYVRPVRERAQEVIRTLSGS